MKNRKKTKISLTNFRIFQKKTDFELAPITILTGANNSGKSSFIKAIKLLAESAEASQLLYFLKGHSETKLIKANKNETDIVFDLEFEINLDKFLGKSEVCNLHLEYSKKVDTHWYLLKN